MAQAVRSNPSQRLALLIGVRLLAQHEIRAQVRRGPASAIITGTDPSPQVADAHLRERMAQDAKRREIARLELAKRLGHEKLSEAEIERIRRDRMKAELLAKAAGVSLLQTNMLLTVLMCWW